MVQRISAQAARQQLGQVMDRVRRTGDTIIVERDGPPMVAIVPLQAIKTLDAQAEMLVTDAFERAAELAATTTPEQARHRYDAALKRLRREAARAGKSRRRKS
jgi:prevent-host-death family protein